MAPRKTTSATTTTKIFANGATEMTLDFTPGTTSECTLYTIHYYYNISFLESTRTNTKKKSTGRNRKSQKDATEADDYHGHNKHQPEPQIAQDITAKTVAGSSDTTGKQVSPVTPTRPTPRCVTFNLTPAPRSSETILFGNTPNRLAPPGTPTRSNPDTLSIHGPNILESSSDSEESEEEDLTNVFNTAGTPSPPSHKARTNTTPSQTRSGHQDHTPRFGPHSTSHGHTRSSGPAGSKTEHKAKDIWPFFSEDKQRNSCIFCQ